MSRLAPILQGFFTDRLTHQRQASPHTIAAYRDSIRLLVAYAATAAGKQPVDLAVTDLDAALIVAFLTHLEAERGNSVSTRNARRTSRTRYTSHTFSPFCPFRTLRSRPCRGSSADGGKTAGCEYPGATRGG